MNLRKKSIVLCMLGLLCALALTFFGGTSAHAAPQLQDSLLQCEYLGYPAAVRDGDSVKCLDYEERLYAYSLSEVCNFSHKFDVEIINQKVDHIFMFYLVIVTRILVLV